MTIEELRVLITAQTAGFNRQLNDIRRQLRSVDSSAERTSRSITKAFNVAKITAFVYAIGKAVSATTELASQLQEVQNVVEVSFGEMTSQVEAFASTAVKQFGMSEYSAKKAASTFMAMGNGMGVAAKEGATMAITLAGLSGDLASFWNTSQEMAETALASVYTGETETLKKYGVVLTETNLKQYALTKGITKSYEELTQAEKVMLRYSYVLEATKNAQGDFVRTSGSWANQIRVLQEQWKSLLTIIGQGLIKALTPAVKFLNQLLSQIITIANAISKAFANVFGTTDKTMSVDTSQMNQQIGETTEEVDGTTEAVEDLNKQLDLTSFDEITRIGDTKDKEDEGGGDFGLDIGEIEIAEGEVGDSVLDQVSERLQSILETIKNAIKNFKDNIPKLDIQFNLDTLLDNLTRLVNAFIEAFGNILTAAATFGINLVNSINWDAVFTNLTNAAISAINILETIFTTLFMLLDNIAQDIQLGAIVEQVTALIACFMNLADVVVSTLAPAMMTFYDTGLKPIVEWIGEKLLDAIQFVMDLMNDWAAWFEENTEGIENFARVLGLLVNTLWQLIEPILNAAWEQFKNVISMLSELFQKIGEYLLNEFAPKLEEYLGKFLDTVKPAIEEFVENMKKYLEALQPILEAIMSFITEVVLPVVGQQLLTVLDVVGNVIATIITLLSNIIQVATGLINFIVGVFTGDWEKAWQGVVDIFEGIFGGIVDFVQGVIDTISSIIEGAINGFKTLFGGYGDFFSGGKSSGSISTSGGSRRSLNAPAYVPASIPALASGGVLYDTTVAMIGEYAGAGNNPEIVAPQNIMMETMEQANAGVINAVMAMGSKVTKAIEDKDTNVYMDSTKVTRKVMDTQGKLEKYKGTTLVNR